MKIVSIILAILSVASTAPLPQPSEFQKSTAPGTPVKGGSSILADAAHENRQLRLSSEAKCAIILGCIPCIAVSGTVALAGGCVLGLASVPVDCYFSHAPTLGAPVKNTSKNKKTVTWDPKCSELEARQPSVSAGSDDDFLVSNTLSQSVFSRAQCAITGCSPCISAGCLAAWTAACALGDLCSSVTCCCSKKCNEPTDHIPCSLNENICQQGFNDQ